MCQKRLIHLYLNENQNCSVSYDSLYGVGGGDDGGGGRKKNRRGGRGRNRGGGGGGGTGKRQAVLRVKDMSAVYHQNTRKK